MKYSTKTERFVRWAVGALASCLIAATVQGQLVVTQSTPIAINDNSKASPYPSTNLVQNLLGTIEKVTVTLNSVSHGYPDDIDIVVEGPDGTKATLMSDAGGQFDLVNTTFTLDSTAGTDLPDEAQIGSATYKPKNYDGGDGDTFFGGPPTGGPFPADLSVFNGKSAGGTWKLYVADDTVVDAGSIGSWSLNLFLSPTISVTNPAITISEDVPTTINVFVNDSDTPLPNLTLSATSSDTTLIANSGFSFGGNTGGTNRTLTITPVANVSGGPVTVTVSVSDGVGSAVSVPITVTITPVNDAPTVTLATTITTIRQGGFSTNIAVKVLDIDNDPQSLILSAFSSDSNIISGTNILFSRQETGGTLGTNRSIQISAGTGTGTATLTIIATDPLGRVGSQQISVTVPAVANLVNANTTTIAIPDNGAATPNPSTITVPNTPGVGLVGKVVVSLINLEHPIPSDVGVLLVAPSGQSVVLMRGAGDSVPVGLGDTNDIRLTFDKDAANSISATALTSGNYRPSDLGSGDFPGAPASPYTSDLNSLQGIAANGVWKLYVYDTTGDGASGQIAGGWLLQIFPAPTLGPIGNQSTPEDQTLVVTFPVGDFDGSVTNLTVQFVNSGDAGTVNIPTASINGGTGTLVIVPTLNFNTGSPAVPILIRVIAQDNSGSFTATNVFSLTVTPVNDSPTQTVIAKQVTRAGQFVGPVAFTISDVESLASDLVVTASSDNPKLLPPGAIILGGTDTARTLTIFPAGTIAAQANITVTVTDPNGGINSQTFNLTVQEPANRLFENTGRIVINDSTPGGSIASPYPSVIPVSGLIGKIAEIQVTLFGITHPTSGDIDALLVGPMGTNIVVLSDTGGANGVTNVTLVFKQSASVELNFAAPIISGLYRPVNNFGGGDFPFGGSPAANTLTLDDYIGANPNGDWKLYVVDDTQGPKGGAIEGGWQLSIRTHSQLPDIADQVTQEDTIKRFTVQIGDVQPGVTNTVTSNVTVPSGQQPVIAPSGIVTSISDGILSVTLTPISDANGTNIVTLSLTDADGFVSVKSFNLVVIPVDDAPRFSSITAKSTPAATPISFTFDTGDPEGTAVTVVGTSSDQTIVKDSNISISPSTSTSATRTITILPEGVVSGSTTITLAGTDATAQKATQSFVLTVTPTLAFQNPGGRIVINDFATANPYPSTIDVSGVNGTVSGASVILVGFSHPFPDDVDILLVSPAPANKAVMLMSDAGGGFPASNLRLAFAVGNPLIPDEAQLVSGNYSPANYVDTLNPGEADEMPSPAPVRPAGGYSTNLADFAGINPNGQWKLYVRDDTFPDGGVIEGGWILTLQTAPTISHVDNQTTVEDTLLQVPFSVGDQDTAASGLNVTATVDSTLAPGLIVPSNLSLTTNGFNYVLSILPSTNRPFGSSPETNVITLNVTDGTTSASTSFQVRVTPIDDAPSVATATNRVVVSEDSSTTINFTVRDVDSTLGSSSNVVVISSNPSLVPNLTNNISISGPNNQGANTAFVVGVTVSPLANQSGSTVLSFIVSDRTQSVTNDVEFDILSVNDLPTISFPTMSSGSPSTNVIAGGTINNIAVTVGDVETPAKNILVNVSSSNQSLIPNENILVGGSGADRTVSLTTVGASTGAVTISVVATDEANGKTTNSFVVNITPSPASVFANSTGILIPGTGTVGNASLYPSVINVSGLSGNISKVSVTLDGLTHSAPDDIDILLVSPSGKKTLLLSDVGGANAIFNVRLLFDQSGRGFGDDAPIVSGTYQPSDFEVGSDTFPSPAPAGPYTSSLQEFLGTNPNGVWSLYIVDDTAGNSGQLAFGWSLRIETAPTIVLDNTSLNAPIGTPTFVQFAEDTTQDIRFTIGDMVTPLGNLAVLFDSSNPSLLDHITTNLSGSVVTATLVPVTNAFGTNNLTITVRRSDGAQSSIVVPINITPVNDIPTISRFSAQMTPADTAITVPILVRDVDTAFSNIWVQATSSNESVISSTNILIAGRTNFLKGVVANFAQDPFTWVSTITLQPNSIAGVSTITITVFEINGTTTNTYPSSFVLTVTPVNHQPTITSIISPQPVVSGQSSTNIAFTVGDSDNDTLTITATSSDQSLVRDSDIVVNTLVGAPGTRTVRIATQPGVQGDSTITITVRDPGNLRASTQFLLRVVPTRERVFSSTRPITIRDNNAADPFPSTNTVSGFSGNVSKVTVTLNGFAHTFPDDVDVLLVSPTGQKVMLMSDAGGGTLVTNLVLKFDDSALAPTPDNSVLTSGTFLPANYEGIGTDNFTSFGGPAGPYPTNLTTLNGVSPNGDWTLFVIDDTSGDSGIITGGWSLGITTLPVLNLTDTNIVSQEDVPATVSFSIAEESFGNPDSFAFNVSSTNAALVPSSTTNIVVTGSGIKRTVTVIPTPNASGTTLITLTEQTSGVTAQFLVTFTPVNDVPVIAQIPDQTLVAGNFVTVTNFNYSDVETAKKDLVVTFVSSNSRVIPVGNIALIGNNLRIFSGTGTGTSLITATVADQNGATATMSFNVTVALGQNPLFANTDGIAINDNTKATPYPSTIDVSGVLGTVAHVSVTLRGLTHPFPDDVDILLVGPNGAGVVVMSDAGAGGNPQTALVNAWLTFDDSASQSLPDNSGIQPFDSYKPTNFELSNSEFAAPAPAGPYSATFNAAFNGINPNGTWSLYVQDDASPDAGSLAGWSLSIISTAPSVSPIPDQILIEDSGPTNINFTVFDGDTAASNLLVTATLEVDNRGPLLTLSLGGSDTNRTLTLTPALHASGTTRATVSVTDGTFTNQTSFNVIITPVNHAPVISGLNDTNTPANIRLSLNFNVTDVETPTSALTITASSSNDLVATTALDTSGPNPVLTVIPTGVTNASVTVSVVASDGVLSATNSFVVIITPPAGPGISAIANQTVFENSPVVVQFTITNSPSTNVTITASASNPNLVSSIILGGTGANRTALIQLVPNHFGFSEIEITITDDFGSATSAFALIVQRVNQPPTLGPIADRVTDEDVPVTITLPVSDDSPLSALTFSSSASNTNLVSGVTFDQSGASVIATVNLVTNQNGLSTVTIMVSDGTFSTNRTFALSVNPVDDDPSIDPIPDQTTNEDVPFTFAIAVSDPDTQISDIQFSGISSDTNLVSGITFVNNGTNLFATNVYVTLTLVSNANILTVGGRPTITITATEGTRHTSRSFLLNVIPIPDASMLDPIGDRLASADTVVTIPLGVRDPDTAISRLTFTGASANPSLVANIRFNNDGTNVSAVISLVPGAIGTSAVTITVSDGTTPISQSFVLTVTRHIDNARLKITRVGADLNITVTGTPGVTYILEGTSDFVFWRTIGGVTIDADGSTDAQDGTFRGPYFFYRARTP